MGMVHSTGKSLIFSLASDRWQKHIIYCCRADQSVTSISNVERLPHMPLSFLPQNITDGTQSSFYFNTLRFSAHAAIQLTMYPGFSDTFSG